METFFGKSKSLDEDFVLAIDFGTTYVLPRFRAEGRKLSILLAPIPRLALEMATKADMKTVVWTGLTVSDNGVLCFNDGDWVEETNSLST